MYTDRTSLYHLFMDEKRSNKYAILALAGMLLSAGIVYATSGKPAAADYTAPVERVEAVGEQAQSHPGYLYYVGEGPTIPQKLRRQIGGHAAYLQRQGDASSQSMVDTELIGDIETISVKAPDRIIAIARNEIITADTVHAKPREQRQNQRFFELLFDDTETAGSAEQADIDEKEDKQKKHSHNAFSAALAAIDKKKYGGAYALLLPLANSDNKNAQYHLGRLFHHGLGIKKDYELAVSWYRNAAEQGQYEAQYQLGNMLLMGEGIGQDYKKAAYWYSLAAEQGHCLAQYNLRNMQRMFAGANRALATSADGDCALVDN